MPNEKQISNKKEKRFLKKSFLSFLFFSILIVVFGLFATIWITGRAKEETKTEFLNFANVFVSGINPTRIESLTNTEKDLGNPDYQRVEEQLSKMANSSQTSGVRWIYTMFLKDNEIVFGPDSIPPGEYGHSEPGEIYFDATPAMRQAVSNVLQNGANEIIGPDTDSWGTWLSVLVPIRNFQDGRILGILGIDIDYSYYQNIIFRRQLLPIISSILVLILFFTIFSYISRIKKVASKLKEEEEKYKKLYDLSIIDAEKIKISSEKLRKINALMVDRELRMIELKKQLNNLKRNN